MLNNQNTIKGYKPKYDKSYRVTCAVFRMLKSGKVDKNCAVKLLEKRAKIQNATAQGTVELWLKYPLKHLR
jgi:hypothetical protein